MNKHWIYYKDNGLKKTIPYILVRLKVIFQIRTLKEFIYKKREFIFFELNINEKNFNLKNNDQTDLYYVKSADIENKAQYFDGWFKKRTAVKRLKKGSVLLTKKSNNKMVFFQWIDSNDAYAPPLDLTFALPNHTAYMTYIYTLPEYRGRKIAKKAKLSALKYLQESQYKNVFLIIAPENIPSINVNKFAGFNEYQTVNYRRWLFVKYYLVKDWNSDLKCVFFRISKKDLTIWKTFSKIQ